MISRTSLPGTPRLLVLAALVTVGVAAPAARQEPTFRTGTRTVPVFVTVSDAGGRLVPDLARGDFEILDNGKPQEITIFAEDPQPIAVVLLLDRSRSMEMNFHLERAAAGQFVTDLWPADRARIGSFSYRIQIDPRDFTSDRQTLLRILATELQEAGPTPLWNAVNAAMTALLHESARRVVLVFTDGADQPGNDRGTNASLKDVMKRAREEDVMVYAVGLTGRVPVMSFLPGRGGGGRGGIGGIGGRRGRGGLGRPMAGSIEQRPDKGLEKIAAESGGGYFELQSADNLAATFSRVADELHHQYALGFVPAKLDGKTHKLEVRLTQAGLTARARTSYVASPER